MQSAVAYVLSFLSSNLLHCVCIIVFYACVCCFSIYVLLLFCICIAASYFKACEFRAQRYEKSTLKVVKYTNL